MEKSLLIAIHTLNSHMPKEVSRGKLDFFVTREEYFITKLSASTV